MRIGVYTINDNHNYGNRLQNYAVNMIMKNYGKTENIASKYIDLRYRIKYYLWLCSFHVMEYMLPKKNFKNVYFSHFNRHMRYDKSRNEKQHYDIYIYGSDQIWNPTYEYFELINPITEKEKNIALSASIGINEIPQKYEKVFGEGLKKFKAISVREESAADIVEKYVGKRPEVLVDPTMYLQREEWIKVERKPIHLKEKNYIVIYFLGNLSNEKWKDINEYAQNKNVAIIDINNTDLSIGPAEFVYLIHHAYAVITDSFHACVFSIIFEREFYVFEREDWQKSMTTRIDGLLSKFNMENRKVSKITEYKEEKIDYSLTREIISEERKKMNQFLYNSLYS